MRRRSTYYIIVSVVSVLTPSGAWAQAAAGNKRPCPVTADKIASIDQGVDLELSCEWLDVQDNGTQHALKAMDFLTDSTRDVRANGKCAFDELRSGMPGFDDLFNAAQGAADGEGQPAAQGYAPILKSLAEANTLTSKDKPPSSLEKSKLVDDASVPVDRIFQSNKTALERIDGLFVSNPNRALYELLNAYPKCGNADDYCQSQYAQSLEVIRTAFQQSPADLAKLIDVKVHGEKK